MGTNRWKSSWHIMGFSESVILCLRWTIFRDLFKGKMASSNSDLPSRRISSLFTTPLLLLQRVLATSSGEMDEIRLFAKLAKHKTGKP